MERKFYLIFFSVFIWIAGVSNTSAAIQQQETETAETGDIILKPTPQTKNAIFKSNQEVLYRLQVINNTHDNKSGRISYLVTTDEGKKVAADRRPVLSEAAPSALSPVPAAGHLPSFTRVALTR